MDFQTHFQDRLDKLRAEGVKFVTGANVGQNVEPQKLLDENADCTQIAQQLLATRHALDSTYVRLNLSFAEQALQHESEKSAAVSEVMARLQQQLGRRR